MIEKQIAEVKMIVSKEEEEGEMYQKSEEVEQEKKVRQIEEKIQRIRNNDVSQTAESPVVSGKAVPAMPVAVTAIRPSVASRLRRLANHLLTDAALTPSVSIIRFVTC